VRTRKERLDSLLVRRGLAESRAQAQALVLAGQVLIGDQRVDKPGTFHTDWIRARKLEQAAPGA